MKRRTLIGGLAAGLATGLGGRAIGARPLRSEEAGTAIGSGV